MTQQKIKILVASHKPDTVYEDEVYTPIQVGRAVSKFKTEMAHMIGDDTGENISEKNPFYCELTAQYWAWKNLNTEYIGLCHYRRYFKKLITTENVDSLFKNGTDVILAQPFVDEINTGTRLNLSTSMEDVQIFIDCIKKVSPNYYHTAFRFLSGNICFPYNMFIMKKGRFNDFAQWQFSILKEMEKHVRLSGYSRQRRIYGYYGEILMGIYCIHHHLRLKFYPVIDMIGNYNSINFYKRTCGNFYRNIIYKLRLNKTFIFDAPAVRIGLKNDGINIC